MRADVTVKISKDELLRALFSLTLYDETFNADEWSKGTADDLIKVGEMIKREIEVKRLGRKIP